jgi:hypothetical protein
MPCRSGALEVVAAPLAAYREHRRKTISWNRSPAGSGMIFLNIELFTSVLEAKPMLLAEQHRIEYNTYTPH